MISTIDIDPVKCIKCGRCVKVCPAWIFRQEKPQSEVRVEHPETCIKCGHCVAVCPTDAVEHLEFPAAKVHKIDRELLPDPEKVMLLIKSRRSNRAFSDKQVPKAFLDLILEAANRAPTASNAQQVEFTLVTDPKKLRQIVSLTVEVFASAVKRLRNPILKMVLKPVAPQLYKYIPTLERLKTEYDNGADLILRGAKAVILIHTPEESRMGCADANLAYQNGSLMAESLGVSQFYTGFVCMGIKQDKKDMLKKAFNIKGTVHAGMALGMPDFKYPNYIDRKEAKIYRF